MSPVTVYQDLADWWVGYYRGPNHHYVCPLPTVVIRWPRHDPAGRWRPGRALPVGLIAAGVAVAVVSALCRRCSAEPLRVSLR